MNAPATPAARDRGSLSIVMMFLVIIVLAGAALIVDGGRAMSARRHAANTAEAAARSAVANQSLTEGFDPSAATARARSHAERSGIDPTDIQVSIQYDPDPQVIVTVTEHPSTVFLVLGGADDMTVRATGAARFVYSL
jgi:Flp pilus assembly protein TadG